MEYYEKENNKVMFKLGMLVSKLGLRERDIDEIIESDIGDPYCIRKKIMNSLKPYLTFMQEIKIILPEKIYKNNLNIIVGNNWKEEVLKEILTRTNSEEEKKEIKECKNDEKAIEIMEKYISCGNISFNYVEGFSSEKNKEIINLLAQNSIEHEKIGDILDLNMRTVKNHINSKEKED